ncbi:MAG: hypothetical protein C0432_00725 [Candidatus Puniceispirillum sp.]|nr:hypothetical protein [Candidatus Pelagibacter sp.]MBA4282806.1 hypothetical protein [Candidatus Puniceispirillum sp.]
MHFERVIDESKTDNVSRIVKSSSRHYQVTLFKDPFDISLTHNYDAVLVDNCFRELIPYNSTTLFLAISEDEKSFITYQKIIDFFLHLKLTKSSRILVIGGGVMHDVCGFAIATYMRGIDWTYIPTTLVSMVDVCIGGKCAVNYQSLKNVVGTVYPPHRVFVYSGFVDTLTISQFSSGLIEALKTAFIGCKLKQFLECIAIDSDTLKVDLTSVIELSLNIKANIVEIDEYDQNIRQNLNFGHTIGHAIESATCHKIEHGLAVGVGILAELLLFHHQGGNLTPDIDLLMKTIDKILNMNILSLYVLRNLDHEVFQKSLKMDKKNCGHKLAFAFPCDAYVPSEKYLGFSLNTKIQLIENMDISIFVEFLSKYA